MLESCRKTIVLPALIALALSGCVSDSESTKGTTSGTGSGGSSSGGTSTAGNNLRPSANAGDDKSATELTTVTLDGSASTDSDGTIASYRWVQIAKDGVPTVTITNATAVQATFDAPDVIFDTEFEFRLFVIDDDGSSAADNVIITVLGIPADLTDLAPQLDSVPTVGATATLSVNVLELIGDATWSVLSQPVGSDISLTTASDKKSVTFMPTVAGDYQIYVESSTTSTNKTISFTVFPAAPAYTNTNVVAYSGLFNNTTGTSTVLGTISNQAWISSSSMDEAALTTLVGTYTGFTVVSYDSEEGLLVEFDSTDTTIPESLALIELTAGIDSVRSRTYEGLGVDKDEAVTPDDGSSGFADGGDNWHLENLNLTSAWDLTTGSSSVMVGISDGGFDTTHRDLDGRVFLQYTDDESAHGNAIAGTIGAVTNNGMGVSGINWSSPLVLADNQVDGVKALLANSSVKVVNGGWAIPGYIDTTFSSYSATGVVARYGQALTMTRPYRQLAQRHPNQLLVWSAGNGVGNGDGNSVGVYGVDGRLHSPAMHYDDTGLLDPLDNVIFVGAMASDGRLKYYSDYGKSVDIAAPSGFKGLALYGEYMTADSYGGNVAGGTAFDGTSSAAATVSGVASLIYSLYPSFTAKEVKDILIDSASTTVTERYKAPGDVGTSNANVATLTRAIPVLDAAAALTMAKGIIDSKVAVAGYTIPDPFTAQAKVQFKSLDSNMSVTSVNWSLESSANGVDGWGVVTAMNVAGDSAEPTLDTTKPYHRLTATVTLTNNSDATTTQVNKTYEFSYSTITVTLKDTVSLVALSGVTVTPDALDGGAFSTTSVSDGSGLVKLYVVRGAYRLLGTLANYQDGAISFTANGEDNQSFEFFMADSTLVPVSGVGGVASMSGFVLDMEGAPVADAVVRISGGASTNGFFASAITDTTGHYSFSNISRKSSGGQAITSFTVQASADGYFSSVKEDCVLLSGKDHTEVIPLVDQSQYGTTVFTDDFESGTNGWLYNSLWHQETLNGSLKNTLVPTYTSLAPDETGPDALLPFAYGGSKVWWYGKADTGTFIGTQSGSDSALSGGTSVEANSGELISPSIDLTTAVSPVLIFSTWWEVESVNPNAAGFDILKILISTDDGATYSEVKKLNPYVDPNDSNRASKPFSSGGFNRKPVWVIEELDLSSYIGKSIKVEFSFDTRDGLYNGFRGWLIDSFRVIDVTTTSAATMSITRGISLGVDEPQVNGYFDGLSESFLDVHKRPQVIEEAPMMGR